MLFGWKQIAFKTHKKWISNKHDFLSVCDYDGVMASVRVLEIGVLKCMFIQLYKCHDISFCSIPYAKQWFLHCYYIKKTKPIIRFFESMYGPQPQQTNYVMPSHNFNDCFDSLVFFY